MKCNGETDNAIELDQIIVITTQSRYQSEDGHHHHTSQILYTYTVIITDHKIIPIIMNIRTRI